MTDDTISRPSRTIAAAVSSQELSIPSTSIIQLSFVKAEGRVALLQCAPAADFADGVLQPVLVVVLDDEQALVRQNCASPEGRQHGQVVGRVGRVEEGNVPTLRV